MFFFTSRKPQRTTSNDETQLLFSVMTTKVIHRSATLIPNLIWPNPRTFLRPRASSSATFANHCFAVTVDDIPLTRNNVIAVHTACASFLRGPEPDCPTCFPPLHHNSPNLHATDSHSLSPPSSLPGGVSFPRGTPEMPFFPSPRYRYSRRVRADARFRRERAPQEPLASRLAAWCCRQRLRDARLPRSRGAPRPHPRRLRPAAVLRHGPPVFWALPR